MRCTICKRFFIYYIMELEIKIPKAGELHEFYLSKHDRVKIALNGDDFANDLNTIVYEKKSLKGWETISFEKIRNADDAKNFIKEIQITYIK